MLLPCLFARGTVAVYPIEVVNNSSQPIHAAVKATYLMPVSVVFSFWFALGIDWLRVHRPRCLTSALAITFPFNVVAGIPIYYAIARVIPWRIHQYA